MNYLKVTGGKRLHGELAIQGAKNSVLPILAATLLNAGESVIHHCPHLDDVDASIRILQRLGCEASWEGDTLTVHTQQMHCGEIPDGLMREMRSSVIFLGAILGRCGEAVLSYPGGCELGPRPIDLHLAALRAMGTEITEKGGCLHCRAPRLRGCEITLGLPSVGATENVILAACGAEGTTVLCNAAREPEIVDLQNFLCACGADVRGAGSSTVVIRGQRPLHDCEHTVISDRIVAATYLAAAAAAGGEVLLRKVDYRCLSPVTAALKEAGCQVRSHTDWVQLRSDGELRAVRPIRTAPYPGFPTDAQAVLMAALLKARGTTVFIENIFENRYRHVDELARLGAHIRTEGRVAVVSGVPVLHGARVQATDLRGGAALAVAALQAEGESRISAVHHIARGYADLAGDLACLGAKIVRVDGEETI